MSTLRPGILAGAAVALAGGGPPGLPEALSRLGARVESLDRVAGGQASPARRSVFGHAPVCGLVLDAGTSFGRGGPEGLTAALEQAWASVREVSGALIAGGRGGKLVLIAPRPDAGPLASAARAGLENATRTLSVEWARYAITACAILPGSSTDAATVCELVSFLLSPAGEYFSGCRLELR